MHLFHSYISTHQKTFFWKLLVLVIAFSALFSSVTVFASSNTDNSRRTHESAIIEDGWEYRLGDSPLNGEGIPVWISGQENEKWKPYKPGEKIPQVQSSEYVWFRVRLPEAGFSDPVLKYWYTGKRIDVYAGGKVIYINNYLDASGWRRWNGDRYYDYISLPDDLKNSMVYFRERTDSLFGYVKEWRGAEISSYRYAIGNELGAGLIFLIAGAILLFIGLLLIVVVLFVRMDFKMFFSFSLIAISSAISLLSMSYAIRIFSAPTFWYYSSTLSNYLLPAGLCMFFMYVFNEKAGLITGICKKSISLLWKLYVLHALIVFILDLAGVFPIEGTRYAFYILFAFTTVLLVAFSTAGIKRSSIDNRIVLYGASIYGITGLIDITNGIAGRTGNGQQLINQWGLFIFIVALILSMVLRYNQAHKKSVEYAGELEIKNRFLKEAWDEIKASHDEVAELNRTLEQKVAERTEQLGEANNELESANGELTAVNEELTAMNEELTATMEALTDTQSQLVQSEKMAALGKLVAGVAHDLNTPVATIKSNIQFEETLYNLVDHKEKESMDSYFEAIGPLRDVNKQACERIVAIVRNLVNFSRLDESDLKEANLIEGLESTLSVLGEQLSEKSISVRRNYSEIPAITCYPKLLNQVFLNLLENAIEAVDNGGKITIGTRFERNRIYIEFKDNGVGIPHENMQKIFDPGYTTKGVKVGISLGLALAYRIVEKHEGRINVESTPGKGTKFTVDLPADKKYE